MEFKATIQGKPIVKTSKTGNPYLSIKTSGGKSVTIFGQTERWPTIEEGFEVTFEGDMKGDNLFQAQDFKLENTQPAREPQPHPPVDSPKPQYRTDNTNDSIQKQTGLKVAGEIVSAYITIGKDVDPNTVIGKFVIKAITWGDSLYG